MFWLSLAALVACILGCSASASDNFRCGGYTPTYHVDRAKAPLNEWPGYPGPSLHRCVVDCELREKCIATLFDEETKMCYPREEYYAYETFRLSGEIYLTGLHYIENVVNNNCTETLDQQSPTKQCNVGGNYTRVLDMTLNADSCNLFVDIRIPPSQVFDNCQDVMDHGINLTRPYVLDQGAGQFDVLCVFNDTSVWEQYVNCSDAYERGAPASNFMRCGEEMHYCEITPSYGRRVYLSCADASDKGQTESGNYSLADLSGAYTLYLENYCDMTGDPQVVYYNCPDVRTKGHTTNAKYHMFHSDRDFTEVYCQFTASASDPVYTSCLRVREVLGSPANGSYLISLLADYSDTASIKCEFTAEYSIEVYTGCQDVVDKGHLVSGIYNVSISGGPTDRLYCLVGGGVGAPVYDSCVQALDHESSDGNYTVSYNSVQTTIYCEATVDGARVVFLSCADAFSKGTTEPGYLPLRYNGATTMVYCAAIDSSLAEVYLECGDVLARGWSTDGVYTIAPDGNHDNPLSRCPIRCEFFGGGGWNVFQRRFDGSQSFVQNWTTYSTGFGSPSGEYWLGNDWLYELANSSVELRVNLARDSVTKYAHYDSFSIKDPLEKYQLMVSGYSGTAGDSLSETHNGMQFTTEDEDNDNYSGGLENCAADFGGGGWWYNDCYSSNLNGVYNQLEDDHSGNIWESFDSCNCSMTASTMMVKL